MTTSLMEGVERNRGCPTSWLLGLCMNRDRGCEWISTFFAVPTGQSAPGQSISIQHSQKPEAKSR